MVGLNATWMLGVFSSNNLIGAGMVLRDSQGNFLAARTNTHQCSVIDPAVAKAMSVREALSWIKEMNMSQVCVESDALNVVNAIKHGRIDSSCFGFFISNCVTFLEEVLSCEIFLFVY